MPDTQEKEATDTEEQSQQEEKTESSGESDGLMAEADKQNNEVDVDADVDEDTGDVYEPAGQFTEDQIDSLPDHMVNDDGTVDAEQLLKQNMGFREKQSDGTLEEAIEFYEEHGGEIEETDESEDSDDNESSADVPESPDEYEITMTDDDGNEMELDEQMESIVKEVGHEANMTEEQLNSFVNNWETTFNEKFTREIDPDEELSKLSDDPQEAQKIVNEVNQHIKQMNERGYITDDEYEEGLIMGGTAEGVSLLRKLMERNSDFKDIPTDQQSVGGDSVQDINSEIEELMDHEAYSDPSHAKHQKVNEKADKLRRKRREMKQSN
jgi:hypothetical protein